MSRHERRRAAKEAGLDWRANQRASRAASRVEALVLSMPASEARRILAEWAAAPGRSQAEVDELNARVGGSREAR
jgi:hypothetical protein